jgi:chromate reductase
MRVLAIAGSLRRASLNRRLVLAAAHCAPRGMTIEVYRHLPAIPVFSEDLEPGPEPVRDLRRRVARSDAILVSTPEYNQSIPGGLKNAIDWLSREDVLAGKPVCIVGASSGKWGTRLAQAALRQVLAATESLVMPAPALYLRDAEKLFDGDRLADPATRDSLAAVLAAFGRFFRGCRTISYRR